MMGANFKDPIARFEQSCCFSFFRKPSMSSLVVPRFAARITNPEGKLDAGNCEVF